MNLLAPTGIAIAAGLWCFSAQATPVEWEFLATGCVNGGCLPGQAYPVTLATLTLAGPDSSGTASFDGFRGPVPAIYIGDSFKLDFSSNYHPLSPAFTQNDEPFGECEHMHEICQFSLSWSESAGQLTAVDLSVLAFSDSFRASLGDATVSSDNAYFGAGGLFSGCAVSACQISGSWVDPAPAPEPGMISIALVWLACLVGAGAGKRRTYRELCRVGLDNGMDEPAGC
jgi:hypothetical protein